MCRFWKIILISLFSILLIGTGAFLFWAYHPSNPMPEAVAVIKSSTTDSQKHSWLTFVPAQKEKTTGIIFYPGGHVDYRAYAPITVALAKKGYFSTIIPMPLNLAVFGSKKATEVINAYPKIKKWVIAGHSFGGVFAAQFAKANPEKIQGMILMASYPADDLSKLKLPVLSLSASNDGLCTPKKIKQTRQLLPQKTSFFVIQGGNHAQFGSYGLQPGDGNASISRTAQQKEILKQILAFLEDNFKR